MGEVEAETMSAGKALREFDAGAEFGIEAKVKPAGGVVVATAETRGEYPVATNLDVQQHSDCGVELVVIAGAKGHPGAEMIETVGGAVFYVPEKLLMAVEDFRSASTQAEQGRIVREPIMRGGREDHRGTSNQRDERVETRMAQAG